jgi:hypothetical protein
MQRQDGNACLSAVSVIHTQSLAKLIAKLVSVNQLGSFMLSWLFNRGVVSLLLHTNTTH